MNKRVGDITLQEFDKICSFFRMICYTCPLNGYCNIDDPAKYDDEVDLNGVLD